jgi:hypothetical protein
MWYLLRKMEQFDMNIATGNLAAARAAKQLIDKHAAKLEIEVYRYASQIIMEGY